MLGLEALCDVVLVHAKKMRLVSWRKRLGERRLVAFSDIGARDILPGRSHLRWGKHCRPSGISRPRRQVIRLQRQLGGPCAPPCGPRQRRPRRKPLWKPCRALQHLIRRIPRHQQRQPLLGGSRHARFARAATWEHAVKPVARKCHEVALARVAHPKPRRVAATEHFVEHHGGVARAATTLVATAQVEHRADGRVHNAAAQLKRALLEVVVQLVARTAAVRRAAVHPPLAALQRARATKRVHEALRERRQPPHERLSGVRGRAPALH
mmetsp:Transcript_5703/g.17272  ORF Transcript_5703/g.17272 Transcript_5703/m.17272 type:complete len:267 (+) Transcript_5703:147-947(+)